MDKFTFKTADGVDVNLEKLSQTFPEVITETMGEDGKIKRVADFEKLKMLLGDSAAEHPQEFYEFTWSGKNEAIFEAAKATTKTLRPCPEESKNWDTTQNLYIEGDNLEALKILQEAYLGKVKMIYIDPPYNTGKDFVYRDNFHKSAEEGKEDETVRDEETDNNLFQNTESNGRFHSDWCSMIYPRLKLARDLLRDDGVIFISIDDNEVHNLRKICDEIFGVDNLVGQISNINNPKGRSDDKFIATSQEYLLVYAKSIDQIMWYGFEPGDEIIRRYNKIDDFGKKYREIDLRKTGENDLREDRPNLFYYFYYNKNSKEFFPSKDCIIPNGFIQIKPLREDNKEGNWRWSIDTATESIDLLEPKFMPHRKIWGIMEKDFLIDRTLLKPTSTWNFKDINSERGSEEFIELNFGKRIFPKPKPIGTIKRCLMLSARKKDSLILDFFSGSATTAHACMQLNAEDGGNRKFIMVQLPEVCAPDSEAAKAGYKNICEIGKERIRRAGEKIKAEHATTAPNLDIGFRVLKIDESIMKDVFYSPNETSQDLLSTLESNIKEDRTDLDLLFACLVDWGVELSMPLKTESIDGVEIHTMNDGDTPALITCFAQNIPETVVRKIAARHPLRAVFRDSSFPDSPAKINVTEIFKTYSPETEIKVL